VVNEEVAATMDPMEQQHKFNQIQQVDNELNTLYEAQSVAKKELHEFRPIIQSAYMQMHQFDASTYSKWHLLVAAKTEVYNKEMNQHFLAEESLLVQKWKDKFGSFQGVKHKSLELVLELGPSFEEVKEEKSQTKEPKEEENTDKGKQQMFLEDVKELRA
jgi:hypothetical protein